MPDTKSTLTGVVLIPTFALLPIYLFSSGGVQLVDLSILTLGAIALLGLTHSEIRMAAPVTLTLSLFAAYGLAVNTVYFYQYADTGFIIASLQTLFSLFVFFVFAVSLKRLLINDHGLHYAYLSILAAAVSPWLIAGKYEEGVRNALSFNNPNQLGYFSVLLYIAWSAISSYDRSITVGDSRTRWWQRAVGIFVIAMVHAFALLSASRAAIAALVLIDCFHIARLLRKRFLRAMIMVLGIPIAAASIFVEYNIVIPETAVVKRFGKGDYLGDLEGRVVERLELGYGSYVMEVVFGRGGSAHERFSSGSKEVHNMFGAAFRSYGVIGLMFLLGAASLYTIAVYRYPGAIWFLGAILLYNMAHNGLRFRPLWVVLALVLVASETSNARSESRRLVEESAAYHPLVRNRETGRT